MDVSIITTAILGGSGILITFFYNRHNRRLAHDKMEKDLFTECNRRYDALNEYLEEIVKFQNIEELNNYTGEVNLRYKLNDYFNLCAEEYYWYKKKRIDNKIWESWEEGMNSWYNNHTIIREVWDLELKNYGHKTFYMNNGDSFFRRKH
ncbi:MAG: hypothetical protein RH981_14125 [Arenibacter sp.]